MANNNEYEVESITMAQLVKKKERQNEGCWMYCVRWKGFGQEGDTWEPPDSFNGSEHFVERFWELAKTDGRDYKHTHYFQIGEEFFPYGNTCRKKPKLSISENPTLENCFANHNNDSDLQLKNQPSSLACRRLLEDVTLLPESCHGTIMKGYSLIKHTDCNVLDHGKVRVDGDQDSSAGNSNVFADVLQNQNHSRIIPSHRARIANPKVKILDNPNIANMDGAICVKARLVNRSNLSTATIRHKRFKFKDRPSVLKKNTSSLLTFENGALKTIKGKYQTTVNAPVPIPNLNIENVDTLQPLPTANELLCLAGAEKKALESLEDFEECDSCLISEMSSSRSDLVSDHRGPLVHLDSTLQPNILPSEGSHAGCYRNMNSRSLTTGGSQPNQKFNVEPYVSSMVLPFILNLDSSTQLPVLLMNGTFDTVTLLKITDGRSPPGRIYDPEFAPLVIDTLRTGGPVAKVGIHPSATDEQKLHFETFRSRLDIGGLFIAKVANAVLVFCSSSDDNTCQRLNISLAQNGQPGDVIVTRVIIENHSIFSNLKACSETYPYAL